MDGMVRSHPSVGVHDPLFARAVVLANSDDLSEAFAVISADICALKKSDADIVRRAAEIKTGIPRNRIIAAATHTHSGPATVGVFGNQETDYVGELRDRLAGAIVEAARAAKPAAAGCASGHENTISRYRRLLADDGHVVMNWEPYPAERILRPLGEIDPEVGVLKVVSAEDPNELICLLFNHAGHPNVLSGDNYLLSADYPGFASRLLEDEFGCTAMFVNGAQGTMDIDGLRDRDFEGLERTGTALAKAVSETARTIRASADASVRGSHTRYTVPPRKISDAELAWAEDVLKRTGGALQAAADGVGDDYRALLYKELREAQKSEVEIEQVCFAVGDSAYISFPGEMFTETGMRIKAASPFSHTWIVGLANGYIGYVPTREAVAQGGYETDVRRVDESAEEIVAERSLTLLRDLHCIKGSQ